jgi:CubicO group peptidase (beta-lactamase class C family)
MTKVILSKLLCIFCLVFSATSCLAQSKTGIKNLKGFEVSSDSITAFLKSRMDTLNIPGLSVAVINDSKVVYHHTFGYANLEKQYPITGKTIFERASMSKSVFAFFVMKFVEEGKLDLDKPLYEYLPYPDIARDEIYKKIMGRMVLSHRSGFPNWRENEEDKKLKIKFESGTAYEYSGEGYQYLAMVLKHIENTDWNGLESIFQEKVAKPLNMENTVFIPTS